MHAQTRGCGPPPRVLCDRTGTPHEQEVESYIRLSLHGWATEEENDSDRRLLLLIGADGSLAALAAHERAIFYESGGNEVGRTVWVIAVATTLQTAARQPGASSLGDLILDELLGDIAAREPADPIISATIHRANGASLNLFKRHGFENVGSLYGDYLIVW